MNKLRLSFCAFVAMLAVFQFSENTADPDLWGHIIFGRQIMHSGSIPRTEIYSWTAKEHPWINHEWLAEIALAAAHEVMGGSGILLLKMAVGLLTFALCLRMGAKGLEWPGKFVPWGFGAVAVVEISYGFAARPQIFTALALAVELWLLRKVYDQHGRWAIALPFLFVVWINTHGGALAGYLLLGLATLVTTAQLRFKNILFWWLALIGATAALFCNPWGIGLIRWLIGSALWFRPEIEEWNPTPLGWDHAAFFSLIVLGIFAWASTRRQRAWWEVAAFGAFAILGWRSARHAPLFALVALAVTPPHLADALARFQETFAGLRMAANNAVNQTIVALLCWLAAIGAGLSTFTLHKEHPLTMEVPRAKYPVGAVDFLWKNNLKGRLLVFFDWGEMAIFELPGCPPSIDGRLDTCYSRELIAAHWKFYNGEPFDRKVLDPENADLALLPANLAGSAELAGQPGWQVVYYDTLSIILARIHPGAPVLPLHMPLPVVGSEACTRGREVFPSRVYDKD
jgi:hypothetical protein